MENMDQRVTVPKWVLIVWPKIPHCPRIHYPNLFAKAQKFWISMKKGLIGRPWSVAAYLDTEWILDVNKFNNKERKG